jgi:hypothetical protein
MTDQNAAAAKNGYTEQGDVSVTYRGGRTRDLRPHTRVFAMAADAKWEVKK